MDTELESSQEQVLESRGSQESSSTTSFKFHIQLTILSVSRETKFDKRSSVTVWLQPLNETLSRFQRCFSTSERLPLAIQQHSEHLRCLLLSHPQYQHKYNDSNQCKNLGHKTGTATKLPHFQLHLNFLWFSSPGLSHTEALWAAGFSLTLTLTFTYTLGSEYSTLHPLCLALKWGLKPGSPLVCKAKKVTASFQNPHPTLNQPEVCY